MTTRFRVPGPEVGQHAQPLGGLVVLGKRALQRQGRALGQRPHVAGSDPRHQVVGQAMRLLIGPGDDDDRPRWPQGSRAGRPGAPGGRRRAHEGRPAAADGAEGRRRALRRGDHRRATRACSRNGTGPPGLGGRRDGGSVRGRQSQPARCPGQRDPRLLELDTTDARRVRNRRHRGAGAEVAREPRREDAGVRTDVFRQRAALGGEARQPGGDVEERITARDVVPVDEERQIVAEAEVVAPHVEMKQLGPPGARPEPRPRGARRAPRRASAGRRARDRETDPDRRRFATTRRKTRATRPGSPMPGTAWPRPARESRGPDRRRPAAMAAASAQR